MPQLSPHHTTETRTTTTSPLASHDHDHDHDATQPKRRGRRRRHQARLLTLLLLSLSIATTTTLLALSTAGDVGAPFLPVDAVQDDVHEPINIEDFDDDEDAYYGAAYAEEDDGNDHDNDEVGGENAENKATQQKDNDDQNKELNEGEADEDYDDSDSYYDEMDDEDDEDDDDNLLLDALGEDGDLSSATNLDADILHPYTAEELVNLTRADLYMRFREAGHHVLMSAPIDECPNLDLTGKLKGAFPFRDSFRYLAADVLRDALHQVLLAASSLPTAKRVVSGKLLQWRRGETLYDPPDDLFDVISAINADEREGVKLLCAKLVEVESEVKASRA